MSDINTAVVDSLKVLDLKWPIREEADISCVSHWPCAIDEPQYVAVIVVSVLSARSQATSGTFLDEPVDRLKRLLGNASLAGGP